MSRLRPGLGLHGAAIDATAINADAYRTLALRPWDNASLGLGFTIDRRQPVPTPEVGFVVPPYGSRLYEAPNPTQFTVPANPPAFAPPPDDTPLQGAARTVFVAREWSRITFTLPRRPA